MLFATLFSLAGGPTKALFVCSNSSTKSAVMSSLIYPLEKAGFGNKIKRDQHFCLHYLMKMARHIGAELPPPYRSEDAFPSPQGNFFVKDGEPRTFSRHVTSGLYDKRLKGHLQIMYYDTGKCFQN